VLVLPLVLGQFLGRLADVLQLLLGLLALLRVVGGGVLGELVQVVHQLLVVRAAAVLLGVLAHLVELLLRILPRSLVGRLEILRQFGDIRGRRLLLALPAAARLLLVGVVLVGLLVALGDLILRVAGLLALRLLLARRGGVGHVLVALGLGAAVGRG